MLRDIQLRPVQKSAIKLLKSAPEMALFVEVIKERQDQIDKALRTASQENFLKLQGQAIAMQDLSSYLNQK